MNPTLIPLYVVMVSALAGPFLANYLQNRTKRGDAAVASSTKLSSDTLTAWAQIGESLRQEMKELKTAHAGEMTALRDELRTERTRREEAERTIGDLRTAVARLEPIAADRDEWKRRAEVLAQENAEMRAQLMSTGRHVAMGDGT